MNTNRRKGFILLLAIAMIAMVGVALAAMGSLLAYDGRRTRSTTDDAQFRQVLIAAEAWTAQRLDLDALSPQHATSIPLPPSLTVQGIAANVRLIIEADEKVATLTAQLPDRQLEQVVRYRRTNGVWRAVAAELSR